MSVRFKIARELLKHIRTDLARPHAFAAERVGFVLAGLATCTNGTLALARGYIPVLDEDYRDDPSVGAMMGPEAIRKTQERALFDHQAIFHVHNHGGSGVPYFSGIDRRENARFIPDFSKVAPQNIHGAIVLSDDAAHGVYWSSQHGEPAPITAFTEIGAPMRKWDTHEQT